MTRKAEPWEVAARLEEAAQAVRAASNALDAAYSAALCFKMSFAREVEAIAGIENVDRGMADALQALSDEAQAIADAEPDDRAEWELRTGFREEDFA